MGHGLPLRRGDRLGEDPVSVKAVAGVDYGRHRQAGVVDKLFQGQAALALVLQRPLLAAVDVQEEVLQVR